MYRSSLILTVKTALKSVEFSRSYKQNKLALFFYSSWCIYLLCSFFVTCPHGWAMQCAILLWVFSLSICFSYVGVWVLTTSCRVTWFLQDCSRKIVVFSHKICSGYWNPPHLEHEVKGDMEKLWFCIKLCACMRACMHAGTWICKLYGI